MATLSDKAQTVLYRYRYIFLISVFVLIWITHLSIDVMEVDSAQYAEISREMAASGQYLEVHENGHDYLDKPPLLFWLSSQSIRVFGNTSIAYKLPTFLFLLLAVWATYHIGKYWYNVQTGLLAGLIIVSTQAFHLMTLDVRTDGLLTAFVILSVWRISLFIDKGKWIDLFSGAICVALAMMTKGPIGMIIPAAAIGGHLLLKGEWKKIFSLQWVAMLLVVMIALTPMCYGLYQQFDLHPEKTIYGLQGPSGLKFFFWTQSFGRITGGIHWNNHAPFYFFVLSMLWDLQPWVILFIPAFLSRTQLLFSVTGRKGQKEWFTYCGFFIPFVLLSFSRYKLPHYIFPLFPFAAVIIAGYLADHMNRIKKWIHAIHWGVIHFLILMTIIILAWAFPVQSPAVYILILGLYALIWMVRKNLNSAVDRLVFTTGIAVWLFQFVLSNYFYPHLLNYQASSEAGKYVHERQPERVYAYSQSGFAFDYYSDRVTPVAETAELDTLSAGTWLYVSKDGLAALPAYKIIKEFDDYRVTSLNFKFLNPKTRAAKLRQVYLVELLSKKIP